MLGFPRPYLNELIYSTIARAGVYFGITSPKELLDEVFGDRKIISTVDLPCHIAKLSEVYPEHLKLEARTIIHRNTLFPLYAWLYRHDRSWLLMFNAELKSISAGKKTRVNWAQRDRRVARQLNKILSEFATELSSPRRSRNWFLFQLDQPAMVKTNIDKMPETKQFFSRHSESVADYQIRRILLAYQNLSHEGETVRRWKIERHAGLSDRRLTAQAKLFMDDLLGDVN